ncbi:DUF6090 family protein [Bacteroidota bacterium]
MRQRLLTENKFSKYLIYAIGEIFLVVIGILIALNINNWNENQKIKKLEIVFLENLQIDLEVDISNFSNRIKESEHVMKNNYFFIHESYKTQENIKDFKTLVGMIVWSTEHFVAQNSTYSELNNSGQLNIFSNKNLKNSIVSHYLVYENVSNHIKEFNEFSTREFSKILPTIVKNGMNEHIFDEPYMFKETDWEFINDPSSQKFLLLESAAAVYANKHKLFKDYFEVLVKQSQLLVDQINEELESKK